MKRSIEVGNIFPFGDKKYAEKMNVGFTDKDGIKKLVHFASYGIGVTRLMGTAVEVFHDGRGIIWPEAIAPFSAHLVGLKDATEVYNRLTAAGVEVLWDDTDRPAGEKFADADLLGMPVRLVVSERTGEKIEFKRRNEDKTELVSLEEVTKKLKK